METMVLSQRGVRMHNEDNSSVTTQHQDSHEDDSSVTTRRQDGS
jgi:hypothetical protein